MSRLYSAAQRVALFLLARGSCSSCGKQLKPGWHADHVVPYHLSPLTDVVNGQALCPKCNISKGDKMPSDNTSRYSWQDEFIRRYHALNRENFTLVACPGSGKTRATLKLAKELMETGIIDYLWIVCPTTQIKKQWWKTAGELGIDIEWRWENGDGVVPTDMSGAAVTYGAVTNQPELHRYHVGNHRTLVIFDEIHHASEEKEWGAKSRLAFELAKRRILLSGTLFRNDNSSILYAQYDEDGYAKSDYDYGYDKAQRDFVCRPIYFPRTGGMVEWEWNKLEFQHTFDDKISQERAAQRLRAATAADLEVINPIAEQILRDANEKLSALRAEGDTRAGGLERMFKQRPAVVISEDADALTKIESFRNNTDRWLISINMISEGVDIPRLRVLSYLTTIASEMYFDQAAGRIARGSDDAFFFFPDEPVLRQHAQRLEELRKLALKEMQELVFEPSGGGDGPKDLTFRSTGGTPENAGIIFGSHRIDQEEYESARIKIEVMGWPKPIPHEVISKFVLALRGYGQPGNVPEEEPLGGLRSERKERLRTIQNNIVRQYCYTGKQDYAKVNSWLNSEVGITKLKHATEEQLLRRLKLAQERFG